jgi:menaquinone C8-methyltransferase
LIDRSIARAARRTFSQAMNFREGEKPDLPPDDRKIPRLLYIHIPFCEKLCPYCSFNRVIFEETICRDFFKALRRELSLYRERGYDFSGIYVGGGTPTVLIEELEEILGFARECFGIREISVETNPNHLSKKNLETLKKAGVNRLSVGVQSFDEKLLRKMDRFEKYGSGESIIEQLKSALGDFDTLNADMIFNFPTQTEKTLERDIEILKEAGIDQITYYPLMVSDMTRSAVEKAFGTVDYRREKRFYDRIVDKLTPEYQFSSVWCFSRRTSMIDEYVVNFDEYAGLGSGSIGYLNGVCYANTFSIEEYISRVGRGEIPLLASRRFGMRDRIWYDFIMKLFGMELDLSGMEAKYGGMLYRHLWPMILAFRLVGGIRYKPPKYILTPRGRYYWVVMMREFFIAVNNFRDFCRSRLIC